MTELVNRHMFSAKPLGVIYEFYLSGEIGPAHEYAEWFDIIRSASENDVVKIHINSEGGYMDTAVQFRRVLGETPAQVVTSVEGLCMSAATIIFLTADMQEVSPHSSIMFHHYSAGMYGKGGDLASRVEHDKLLTRAMYNEVYKYVLSPQEIDNMITGQDYYFSADDILPRLEERAAQMMAEITDEVIEEVEAEIELEKQKPKKRTKK